MWYTATQFLHQHSHITCHPCRLQILTMAMIYWALPTCSKYLYGLFIYPLISSLWKIYKARVVLSHFPGKQQCPEWWPPDHTWVAEPCWGWGSVVAEPSAPVPCLGYEQISPSSYGIGWMASFPALTWWWTVCVYRTFKASLSTNLTSFCHWV